VKAPTSTELTQLTQVIARRVGRFLERQGLLERDAENSYLAGDAVDAGPMAQRNRPAFCIPCRSAMVIHIINSGTTAVR